LRHQQSAPEASEKGASKEDTVALQIPASIRRLSRGNRLPRADKFGHSWIVKRTKASSTDDVFADGSDVETTYQVWSFVPGNKQKRQVQNVSKDDYERVRQYYMSSGE
jgi:hypothetical protein